MLFFLNRSSTRESQTNILTRPCLMINAGVVGVEPGALERAHMTTPKCVCYNLFTGQMFWAARVPFGASGRADGDMHTVSKFAHSQAGDVVQLVRTLPCHGRGREFESRRPRQLLAVLSGAIV